MPDDHADGLNVPGRYDGREAEAFRDGYAQALTHIGHGALSTAADLGTGETSADETNGDSGVCATCGASLLAAMGADESDHSPAGYTCPSCEL